MEFTNFWCIVLFTKAEAILYEKGLNHEYGPISGDPDFCDAAAKLAFGEDSPVLKNKSNCTVQVIIYCCTYTLQICCLTK